MSLVYLWAINCSHDFLEVAAVTNMLLTDISHVPLYVYVLLVKVWSVFLYKYIPEVQKLRNCEPIKLMMDHEHSVTQTV